MSSTFPTTTVFLLADGKLSVPGRANAPTPDGAKRIELNSIREVERFEKVFTAQTNARDADTRDAQLQAFSDYMSERRKELKEMSRTWQPEQRAFADAAIAYGNEKDKKLRMNRMGRQEYFLEPLHYDASNRSAWRDVDTGWKERR